MSGSGEAGKQTERAFRVLVVDDNHDAADSLCALLVVWGYDYRVAYDGPTGLALAQSYQPDCLLLDIGLPGMDGYTLARRIREQPGLEGAKLVALTAYSDEAHTRRAQEAGFDYRLTKPADPSEIERLLTMLNRVMELASRTEELARVNVTLAGEAKDLLREVKEDIREVKQEVKELKEDIREVKEGKIQERQE